MRHIFLFLFVFSFLLVRSQAKDKLYQDDWYGIGYKGLSHLRIEKSEIEQGEQTFGFGNMKKHPRSRIIVDQFYKDDLVCFIYKGDSESTIDWMQAVVFRKGRDSTYIDMIGNCPEETDEDTATMKKMFYACDSSSYMPVRYYDRKTIERFRLLKSVKNITAADLKKARELFFFQKESLKKKFDAELFGWVEPMLNIQQITEILIGLGYNPMLSTSQYKSLFNFTMYES